MKTNTTTNCVLATFAALLIHCTSGDDAVDAGASDASTPSADASVAETSVADTSASDASVPLDAATCSGESTGCPPGQVCRKGACEIFCPPPQVLCGTTCSTLSTDVGHCGACGTACAPGLVCSGGACAVTCGALARCGDACADTKNDPKNCGQCGSQCASAPNALPVCAAGSCATACVPGYADCNNNPLDGCETNLATSTSNCGGCGKVCGLIGVVQAACTNGQCGFGQCDSQHANCDGVASNGCEVSTYYGDTNNCGACNRVCVPAPHTQSLYCSSGSCVSYNCESRYGDCDGDQANGCETQTTTDDKCGNCYTKCGVGLHCNSTTYSWSSYCECNAGTTSCNGACTDLKTDALNCGACNQGCTLANSTGTTCTQGACTAGTCKSGWDDCDGTPSDGCETHLTNDAAHCGACGTPCPSGSACVNSACTAAPACVANASPKVLVYHTAPANLFNELPPGAAVSVANDTTWTSKTTADFAKYDLVIIESCNAQDLTSAFATRITWSPAITGRVLVNGAPGKSFGGGDIESFQTAIYKWLTSGLGTALYVGGDCGSRSLDFLSSLGSFSSVAASGQSQVEVTEANHPAMVGTTSAMLSGYWYSGATITAPSTFDTLAAMKSTSKSLVVARDVLCAAP